MASVIVVAVLAYLQGYLNDILAEMGTPIALPLLSLLMIAVPICTVANAGRVSRQKKQKLNASETTGIIGRYIGAVIGSVLTMVPAYAAIIICMYVIEGLLPIPALESFAVIAAFTSMVCALTMVLNTKVKAAGSLTFLIVFIIVPVIVLMFGPLVGLVSIETVSGFVPLVDTLVATATNGFGGLTVLTLGSLVLPVPTVPTDLLIDILLPVAWALLFLGLTIIVTVKVGKKY